MVSHISERLERLKARRQGTDRLAALDSAQQIELLVKSLVQEAGWEKRADNQPHTRYALGSMQEVDSDYTKVSLETAERVRAQLDTRLQREGLSVSFRLQGSVPANIHIRGVSDVDLLVLDESFLTFDRRGLTSSSGGYRFPTARTTREVLTHLRSRAEAALEAAFPAAEVAKAGAKAICISKGSLARPVDVVPSHWHDTVDYQTSRAIDDRGVTLWDKKAMKSLDNMPFRHIGKLSSQDLITNGGLKKAIRLCKNVKADSIEDGRQITISSFDIASALFYADSASLRIGASHELAILSETQRHLDHLATNFDYARSLWTPDGTRKVFDSDEKLVGVRNLSIEIDQLTKAVALEQRRTLASSSTLSWDEINEVLVSSYV